MGQDGYMIDLYTWSTPNGRKVSILLEELQLEYNVISINIFKDEQFDPSFLEISPNNKIPVIIDKDTDISLMESGAIMIYLAEKTGRLLAESLKPRMQVMQWLMWQMGGIGPMLGQAHHFLQFNKGVCEYAELRYANEANRLYGVLDSQLAKNRFICVDYSIADIATWPWISRYEWQGIDMHAFQNVLRWYTEMAERPAVQRGYNVPKVESIPTPIPIP